MKNESFQRVKTLLHQAQFDKALQIVNALGKKKDLSPEDNLTRQILKSRIHAGKGDYKESIHLAETALTESQRLGKTLQEIDASIVLTEVLEAIYKYDDSLKMIDQAEQKLTALTGESRSKFIHRKASLMCLKGSSQWKRFQAGGTLEEPLTPLEESLTLFEELHDKYGIALALRNIGVIYDYKGDPDLGLNYYQRSLELFEELGNKPEIAACLNNMGKAFWDKKDPDRALQYYRQSLVISEEIGTLADGALYLFNIGNVQLSKGNLNQATKSFQKILTISEKIGDRNMIALALAQISNSYLQYGELNLTLEHISKSLAVYQEIDYKHGIAYSLNILGSVYLHKGELKLALDNLQKSLAGFEDKEAYQNSVWPLLNLAAAYRVKGDFTKAIELFKKCLSRSKENEIEIVTAYALYYLTILTIDTNRLEEAKNYSQQLQNFSTQVKQSDKMKSGSAYYAPDVISSVNQLSQLSGALVLKNSPRLRDKIKAQEIFEQVVGEETEFRISFDALLNLCDLLLLELRTSGEEDVFLEAKSFVQRFTTRAKQTQFLSFVVDALILQAKFAMVDGDLTGAAKLLDQAQITAEEKGFTHLAMKVSYEIIELERQYDNWQRLIQNNAPFQARLEKAQLEDYLKEAVKLARLGSVQPNP